MLHSFADISALVDIAVIAVAIALIGFFLGRLRSSGDRGPSL